MTTGLRFHEHEEFHKAATAMVIAGAGASAVAWTIGRAGYSLGSIAAVAGAVALAAMVSRIRRGPFEAALRLALVGLGILCLALRPGVEGALGFGVLFAGALAYGLRGARLVAALAVGGSAGVLAHHALAQVVFARQLAELPPWLTATLAGTAFGAVSVLAIAVRHVTLVRDPVAASFASASDVARGEVRELVQRAHAVWEQAATSLRERDANREILQDAVLRLFDTARRWSSVEESAPQSAALVERMESLDQRIEAAQDDVVKGQYAQAREALAEQLKYLKEISTSRDRVLARMHNYLAAMERLRLAVVNLDSRSASAQVVAPILSSLEELGHDIDSSTEALDEATTVARS